MLPDDPSLRRRLLVAIVLVVVLPFVFIYSFVAAVNWILLPLLEEFGHGPYDGRFYVSPGLAVVVVAGGLLAQAWFGPRTVLSSIGAHEVSDAGYPELVETVTRLAHQADMPAPAVALTRNSAPNAAAVDGPNGGTVVVTTGLLETVSDDELEAVLAHEIAHLKNRDATVMTVAWLLPTLTYYLAIGTGTVLYWIYRGLATGSSSRGNGRGMAHALLVLTVTAVITIAISAMFWVASVLVHRVLSRYREYAADRAAVGMTGDPASLASALRTLDDNMRGVPDRDLRRLDGGAEALYIVPLEGRAFTDAALVSTDIFPATHPPTERRIERLSEIAGELA